MAARRARVRMGVSSSEHGNQRWRRLRPAARRRNTRRTPVPPPHAPAPSIPPACPGPPAPRAAPPRRVGRAVPACCPGGAELGLYHRAQRAVAGAVDQYRPRPSGPPSAKTPTARAAVLTWCREAVLCVLNSSDIEGVPVCVDNWRLSRIFSHVSIQTIRRQRDHRVTLALSSPPWWWS